MTQTKILENPIHQAQRLFAVLVFVVVSVLGANAARAQITPESFADLADAVSPAVVNITTSTVIDTRDDQGETTPFDELFRDFGNRPDDQQERRGSALGSGFIISADGYVVTNNHVIEDADEIVVELFEGSFLDAVSV